MSRVTETYLKTWELCSWDSLTSLVYRSEFLPLFWELIEMRPSLGVLSRTRVLHLFFKCSYQRTFKGSSFVAIRKGSNKGMKLIKWRLSYEMISITIYFLIFISAHRKRKQSVRHCHLYIGDICICIYIWLNITN